MRFIVALIALLASDAAMAQHQTFRDASGRTLGRSVTDARGNTTYYDSMGRNTGRSVTDSNGNTTFYDEMGRTTGRSATDSNGTTILYDSMGRRTGTIQGSKRWQALVGIRKPAALTIGWFDPTGPIRGPLERLLAWAGRLGRVHPDFVRFAEPST